MPPPVPGVVTYRSRFGGEYWLSRCEGYVVDDETGTHVGLVEDVLWTDDGLELQGLAVRCWLRVERVVVVPVAGIAQVRPEDERIVVPAAVCRRAGLGRRPAQAEPSGRP